MFGIMEVSLMPSSISPSGGGGGGGGELYNSLLPLCLCVPVCMLPGCLWPLI